MTLHANTPVCCRCWKDLTGKNPALAAEIRTTAHEAPWSVRFAFLIAAAFWELRSLSALQIDILSGHQRAGVSGRISVNGVPFKAADFRKQSCYVLQRDVLLATGHSESLFACSYALHQVHLGSGTGSQMGAPCR